MKQIPFYLAATLGGLFCTMGADCLPDPVIEVPIGVRCTTADLPGCKGPGKMVVGYRPSCGCANTGGVVVLPGEGPGSGSVAMQLKPGWSFGGISNGIPVVSLSGQNAVEEPPVTSQPMEVIDTEFSAGSVDFAFEAPGAGFHEVAGMSKLGAVVDWDGPLVVTLINPSGVSVDATLGAQTFVPLTMDDDCETRTFTGEMNGGPVTLKIEAHTSSPGCD